MFDAILWTIIGAMTGWIGYLASRGDKPTHIIPYLAVGIIGGILGGVTSRALGLVNSSYAVNPDSVFSALVLAVLFVGLYAVAVIFFGASSKSR